MAKADRVTDLVDPRRCQWSDDRGQCPRFAADGLQFCETHGHAARKALDRRELRQYLLTRVESATRLAQLSGHDGLKSLREEAAIAVALLEKRLNLIGEDSASFLASLGEVRKLLETVTKVKTAAESLERKTGAVLSRSVLQQAGQRICQILVERLEGIENYETIVEGLIVDIVDALRTVGDVADDA